MRLVVRLTPRGGRDAIEGWARDADGRAYLKARVAAAPVEGEANAALERLLARALGKPRRAVRVVGGASSRLKQLDIDGLEASGLYRTLGKPPPI